MLTAMAAGSGFVADLRADSVVWRDNLMDAQFRNRPLLEVLQSIATATGWRVYLEPNTSPAVTAQFERLAVTQALPRLLGDLNFALIPNATGPARLYVFRTTSAGATERIDAAPATPRSPSQASNLANELIVTLKPGAGETIEQLAQRLGAKIVGRIDDLNAYRLEFDGEESAARARAELEQHEDVESVDSNHLVQPPARLEPMPLSQAPPLNLRPKVVPNGEYTVVALIDTGVASSQSNIKDFLLPSVSLVEGAEAGLLSHGTVIAETILRALSAGPGGAEGTVVRILPIDVYGNNPATTTFDVGRGIYAAAEAGPTVINLSLGTDNNSPFLYRLIQDVSSQGVLVIAAAGNQPVTTPVYPAAYPEVLAVTASDRHGQIAPYANRGDFVDVMAPGTAVVQVGNQAYLGTGTSYSAAYISGVAAGLVTGANQTTAEALTTIRQRFGPQSNAHPAP
jgi:thermitase